MCCWVHSMPLLCAICVNKIVLRPTIMGIFEPLFLAIIFLVLRIPKNMGEKKPHLLWLLIFLNWFYVVLIGLLVCVVKGKRSQRPPRASVVSARTGGVSPAMSNCHRCCRCCCCCCLLLLLRLLLDTTAASCCCSCCCGGGGGSRFHMMEKPSQPRRRP